MAGLPYKINNMKKTPDLSQSNVTYKDLPEAHEARYGWADKSKLHFSFRKNATVQNQRSHFSDKNDLIKYIKSKLGITSENNDTLRFTVCRKGKYQKINSSGQSVFTTGDPVLDLITDDEGRFTIGNVTHDTKAQDSAGDAGVITTQTRDTTTYVDEETGKSITFHAWKKSFGYWSIGVEIKTSGGPFEQATISSQYGENEGAGVCAAIARHDADANDSYVDQYEWGIASSQPNEVRAACGARWMGQEIYAFVQAGSGCSSWLLDRPQPYPFSEWSTNTQIPNLKSKAAPALVAFNNRLHMVFIGDSSNDIFHFKLEGNVWVPAVGTTGKIPGQQSKASPALAVFNNVLHMVHLGNSSNDIWYSTFNNVQWTTNVQSGQQSKDTPALAVYNGALHMVHIGSGSNNLYHRVLNANHWVPLGADNGKIPNQSSKAGPALTPLGLGLHMLHLGDSSNDIWYTEFRDNHWSTNQRTGQKSSTTPALAGNKLTHIGSDSRDLWESDYLGPNWFENRKIPGQSSKDSPSMERLNGRLYMVHLGNTSNNIWISSNGD